METLEGFDLIPEAVEVLPFGDMHVSGSGTVPSSRSHSLLAGEFFEAHAERPFGQISVDGSPVREFRCLRDETRDTSGPRVDDWLGTVEAADGWSPNAPGHLTAHTYYT